MYSIKIKSKYKLTYITKETGKSTILHWISCCLIFLWNQFLHDLIPSDVFSAKWAMNEIEQNNNCYLRPLKLLISTILTYSSANTSAGHGADPSVYKVRSYVCRLRHFLKTHMCTCHALQTNQVANSVNHVFTVDLLFLLVCLQGSKWLIGTYWCFLSSTLNLVGSAIHVISPFMCFLEKNQWLIENCLCFILSTLVGSAVMFN